MLFAKLEEGGDRKELPREVDFAAVFPSSTARNGFMEEQFAAGYHLGEEGTWEDDEGGHWCVIAKATTLERSALCESLAVLRASAERHGGDFDGWQSPVMK